MKDLPSWCQSTEPESYSRDIKGGDGDVQLLAKVHAEVNQLSIQRNKGSREREKQCIYPALHERLAQERRSEASRLKLSQVQKGR